MICSGCGTDVVDTARYCANCGAPIDEETIARPPEDLELRRMRSVLEPRYRLVSLLGRGGMGTVYKAYEPSLDRFVAIKLIPPDAGRRPGFVERFRREAKLAARLRHPRIASIFEVGEASGIHYFAMDFVEGESLRALVRAQGALTPDTAIEILCDVSDAVAHAHRKGIIHRDLKPENVMIGSENEVFVMDFGLARGANDPALTTSGTVMGTPLYMSPEQLAGEPVDERGDVFALGLILYYCLTGQNLFEAESISAIISKQLSIDVGKTISCDGRIPSAIVPMLGEALQKDVDRRTSSASEFCNALKNAREGSDSVPDEPEQETTIRLGSPSHHGDEDARKDEDAEARRRRRLRSFLDN